MSALHEDFKEVDKLLGSNVLVVWGDKDTVVPAALIPTAKTLLSKATFLVVVDATHSVCVEETDQVVRAIMRLNSNL